MEALRSKRYILVLSHMRCYSSLLCHILNSNPEVAGYVETHSSYHGRSDLWRLKRRVFNEIVVQEEGKEILDIFGIVTREYEKGYYTADAIEAATTIGSHAVKAGAQVFNCVSVEDVMIREGRVIGLVITWSPVEMTNLHVDPLSITAKHIVDATGHDTEVLHFIARKADIKLATASGGIMGERSMWSEKAERLTVENTKRICPGVYVAGMSANAAFGGPRMGPIFGGMLLSGKKVADLIIAGDG